MLTTAEANLAAAKKEGNPWKIGQAHLEMTEALLQRSAPGDIQRALTEAKQAIESFSSIPNPGGIASAHIARAATFTGLAQGESDPHQKAAYTDYALTDCLAAQRAINTEGVNAGQIFDVISTVSVLFLHLKGLFDDPEYQEKFQQLIESNSTLLGELVAEDLLLREEGDSLLHTAQMLGALAAIEENEQEKQEILETQHALALQAGLWMEEASDSGLIEQALTTSRKAQAAIKPETSSSSKTQSFPCPHCGFTAPPSAKFCNNCGTKLSERR